MITITNTGREVTTINNGLIRKASELGAIAPQLHTPVFRGYDDQGFAIYECKISFIQGSKK